MDAYFEVGDEPITFELGEDNPRNREGREAQERAWALRQEKIDARIAAEEAEAAPEIDSADLQKVFDEETAKEHQRSTGWAT